MTIADARTELSEIINSGYETPLSVATINTVYNALDHLENYRWHSLLKDSADLPEDDCTVRICFHYPHSKEKLYGKCLYRVMDQVFDPLFGDAIVIGWRLEEPFGE